MISLDNIAIRFGSFDLLENVGFQINSRDRIGLVGNNGAGKSTLLKVIYGLMEPSDGGVSKASGITIGYLPQQLNLSSTQNSVLEETKKAFDATTKIQAEIEALSTELEQRTDYTSDSYIKAAENLAHLNEHLQMMDINKMDSKIERVLRGLGFLRSDFDRKISEFSGGWRMRVELAKILLQNPDLILLDEPTNHLDINSILWLEEFLMNYRGAFLVISHDKYFLDNITDRIFEVENKRVRVYDGNYSAYIIQRELEKLTVGRNYENTTREIRRLEEVLDQQRRWKHKKNKKTHTMDNTRKAIARLEKTLVAPDKDPSRIHIKFAPAPPSGKIVVECKALSKSYGDNQILDKIDLVVERGEKIAFVGRNGEGKSTLSKVIIGETEHDGELRLGQNISIGYYAQNQDELLDPELTVYETLDHIAEGDIRTRLRDILGAFLFSGEDIEKKVKVLSGGEHSRLSMAKLLLQPYNLLVLDEPTNHLDIRSKDILKQALQNYDGTLIIVSHDRYFLDDLVSKVYEFSNKKIRMYLGGISEFLEAKELEDMREIETKDSRSADDKKVAEPSGNKLKYIENKEKNKERRAIQNRIEKHEKEIARIEAEIEEVKKQLSATSIPPEEVDAACKKSSQLYADLEQQMELWEQANVDLEEFEKNFS